MIPDSIWPDVSAMCLAKTYSANKKCRDLSFFFSTWGLQVEDIFNIWWRYIFIGKRRHSLVSCTRGSWILRVRQLLDLTPENWLNNWGLSSLRSDETKQPSRDPCDLISTKIYNRLLYPTRSPTTTIIIIGMFMHVYWMSTNCKSERSDTWW